MILGFIREAFFYGIAFAFIYIIVRGIYIKKKHISIIAAKEIWMGLLWIYIFVLLSQTILPLWQCGFCDGKFYFQVNRYGNEAVNFIPFKTITAYLFDNGSISEWQTVSELNLLANIGLFVPIGLLLPFVYRVNGRNVCVCGLALSILIEIVQIFIGRSVDIDDVILNVLGTVVGYCLYYFINKQVLLKLKQ